MHNFTTGVLDMLQSNYTLHLVLPAWVHRSPKGRGRSIHLLGSCTRSRMDTIPNGHHPEWTPSRMDTIPNGHYPECTLSRMDTILNGYHPERTRFRMSNYIYIITLVFYSYCLVRSHLQRRGFN